MKRLCLLLTALLLLTGCTSELSGLLDASGAPSADLGERPGYRPSEVSGTMSEEDPFASEQTGRNMAFEPTDTPGLYRVLTRTGDLEVLGMTYGDGTYFALTRREAAISVTGYNDSGAGIFAGHVDEELADPTLLGFTAGYACIYSPAANTTLACRGNGTYIQLIHEPADEVWLYDGGFAMRRGNVISLYPPNTDDPIATFTLPEGYTWVQGNQTGAWVEKNGKLHLLSADGKLSGGLSPLLTVKGEGYLCKLEDTAVVVGPASAVALYDKGIHRLLACGKEYAAAEGEDGLRLYLFEEGKKAVLPTEEGFSFIGRTNKGFLYLTEQGYFWYADSHLEGFAVSVTMYATAEGPLDIACRKLESLLEDKGIHVSSEADYFGTIEADGEKRFAACRLLLESDLPAVKTVFLCSSVTVEGEAVSHYLDGENLYLDISRPEELPSILQSLTESEN